MSLQEKLGIKLGSKTVSLPTKGALGNPLEVTIRPYLAKDEKLISTLTANDADSILPKLAKTLVHDESFNLNKAVQLDILAILLGAKILTYGAIINSNVTCPECGHNEDITIDVSTFKFDDKPFKHNDTFTFPNAKVKIDYHILTYEDELKVKSTFSNMNKLFSGNNKGNDNDEINKMAAMIDNVYGVDGKIIDDLSFMDKVDMLKELITKPDMEEWTKYINDNSVSTLFVYENACGNCGNVSEYRMITGYDFFFLGVKEAISISLT